LIGAVVSTSKARAEQGSAGALPLTRKFLGEFENLSFKKGSQEKNSKQTNSPINQNLNKTQKGVEMFTKI